MDRDDYNNGAVHQSRAEKVEHILTEFPSCYQGGEVQHVSSTRNR